MRNRICRWLALVGFVVIVGGLSAQAQDVRVNGYYRSNGTYVQPYYRSAPDRNPYNNYSFPGNTNPYTGQVAPGNADTYLQRYYERPTYKTPRQYKPEFPRIQNSTDDE